MCAYCSNTDSIALASAFISKDMTPPRVLITLLLCTEPCSTYLLTCFHLHFYSFICLSVFIYCAVDQTQALPLNRVINPRLNLSDCFLVPLLSPSATSYISKEARCALQINVTDVYRQGCCFRILLREEWETGWSRKNRTPKLSDLCTLCKGPLNYPQTGKCRQIAVALGQSMDVPLWWTAFLHWGITQEAELSWELSAISFSNNWGVDVSHLKGGA